MKWQSIKIEIFRKVAFLSVTGVLVYLFYLLTLPPQSDYKVQQVSKPIVYSKDYLKMEYKAHWGTLEFPVVQEEEPKNIAKRFEVHIDTLFQLLEEPLYFSKNGKPMKLDLVSLVFYPQYGRGPRTYYVYRNGKNVISDWVGNSISDLIENGAMISIRGFIENTAIQSASFLIIDPTGPYRPPVYIDELNPDADIFGFQIYYRKGRKALVRLDTLAESNRHIFEMYTKQPAYEVLHIPGFRTLRRFVHDSDQLKPALDFQRKYLLDEAEEIDIDQIPEYADLKDKKFQLQWGNLFAPVRNNYNIDALKKTKTKSLQLKIGRKWYPLKQFDCWVIPEKGEGIRFVANNIHHQDIQSVLENIPPKTSIFFDNIVIEDEAVMWYFPAAFVYCFE